MKYRLPINGLRHHDFKGRLDELYELAPGRRMSISIEQDNPSEANAIIAYMGNSFVGYVRSGKDRELAYSIIKASGRNSLLGKIVGVDREKRWLWLKVTSKDEIQHEVEYAPTTVLTNWRFDGELLPVDEAELRLHTMLCNLETTLEELDPWDEDMEQWLEYIEQNLWLDISLETSMQVSHILGLLTSGSNEHPEYEQKASRLQMTIDMMGSPEVRQVQALQIIKKASSKEMDVLMMRYGDKAKECIKQLPEVLKHLFLEDGETFMGRLWYLHCPYKQIREVKTLLAMIVRLEGESEKKITNTISEQWLLAWGTLQKDKQKAEMVREIVDTFEMEQTNPELAQRMQQMIDSCNTALIQADALKAVASKPTIQADHYYAEGALHEDKSKQLHLSQQ